MIAAHGGTALLKIVANISGYVERLRTAPGEEIGRWGRFLRFQLQLWRYCARRLWINNLTAMSAALSFRTIFALIPTIVLAVLFLKSVGVLEDGKRSLRQFLETTGFTQIVVVEQPAGGEAAPGADGAAGRSVNVANEIEQIVGQVESKLTVERLGPIGVVLLIWTALGLLTAMEQSLNRVFGAERARSAAKRLLLYWGVLTLGPLAWAAAAYGARQAAQVCAHVPGLAGVTAVAGWAGPAVVGIMVVAAIYKLLPNTHVRYRAAIGGAVVSVPLWLLAKWGFALYVSKCVGTGNLYGALGLLPLFLVWLNTSWLVFLFGAELAHTAANLGSMQLADQAARMELGQSDLLAAAIAVAGPYAAGRGPVAVDEVAGRLHLPAESARSLLEKLRSANVVCFVDNGAEGAACVLARPAERIPILDIMGVISNGDGRDASARAYQADIAAQVGRTWTRARSAMSGLTLADAMGGAPAERSAQG